MGVSDRDRNREREEWNRGSIERGKKDTARREVDVRKVER